MRSDFGCTQAAIYPYIVVEIDLSSSDDSGLGCDEQFARDIAEGHGSTYTAVVALCNTEEEARAYIAQMSEGRRLGGTYNLKIYKMI